MSGISVEKANNTGLDLSAKELAGIATRGRRAAWYVSSAQVYGAVARAATDHVGLLNDGERLRPRFVELFVGPLVRASDAATARLRESIEPDAVADDGEPIDLRGARRVDKQLRSDITGIMFPHHVDWTSHQLEGFRPEESQVVHVLATTVLPEVLAAPSF